MAIKVKPFRLAGHHCHQSGQRSVGGLQSRHRAAYRVTQGAAGDGIGVAIGDNVTRRDHLATIEHHPGSTAVDDTDLGNV